MRTKIAQCLREKQTGIKHGGPLEKSSQPNILNIQQRRFVQCVQCKYPCSVKYRKKWHLKDFRRAHNWIVTESWDSSSIVPKLTAGTTCLAVSYTEAGFAPKWLIRRISLVRTECELHLQCCGQMTPESQKCEVLQECKKPPGGAESLPDEALTKHQESIYSLMDFSVPTAFS